MRSLKPIRSFRHALAFLAGGVLLVLSACDESVDPGACVFRDGPATYCMENEETDYCAYAGVSFHSGKSCPSVGFPNYCTSKDMAASGSDTVYAKSRYLNNEACDPEGAPSGGSGAGAGASGPSASGPAYVQFYADPSRFSLGAGYEITRIESVTDGQSFVPRGSVGTCAEETVVEPAVIEGAVPLRILFRLYARNYHSAAVALGEAEYTEEQGTAVFYASQLEPGCNTFSVSFDDLYRPSLILER